ncbi:MAG: hypothetical protein NVS2B16_23560 [Chloroflexota bacterium]
MPWYVASPHPGEAERRLELLLPPTAQAIADESFEQGPTLNRDDDKRHEQPGVLLEESHAFLLSASMCCHRCYNGGAARQQGAGAVYGRLHDRCTVSHSRGLPGTRRWLPRKEMSYGPWVTRSQTSTAAGYRGLE